MVMGAALLAKLASGVVPAVAGAINNKLTQTGGVDFAKLLADAADGNVASNQAVSVSPRCKLQLSAEQMARLGVAADRAASAGLNRALVMLDGRALIMDVQTRQVVGTFDPASRDVSAIDGVVAAPGAADAQGGAGASVAAPLPAGVTSNASLARLLQSLAAGKSAA